MKLIIELIVLCVVGSVIFSLPMPKMALLLVFGLAVWGIFALALIAYDIAMTPHDVYYRKRYQDELRFCFDSAREQRQKSGALGGKKTNTAS